MKVFVIESRKHGTKDPWTRNEDIAYDTKEEAIAIAVDSFQKYKATDYRIVKIKYEEKVLNELVHGKDPIVIHQ